MVINFDRDAIVGALKELVDELVEIGASALIGIVGGAAIAVSYARESTTIDIDALYGSASEVEQATRNIAQRHGWPVEWGRDNLTPGHAKLAMVASSHGGDDATGANETLTARKRFRSWVRRCVPCGW